MRPCFLERSPSRYEAPRGIFTADSKTTRNAARDVYAYVPDVYYDHAWTDEMLYERYGLTREEIAYIESVVAPME